MNHTPEPWVTITKDHMAYDLVGNTGIGADGLHWAIGQDQSNQSNYHEGNAEADARRIVACVNALAGIENPAEWVATAKEIKQKYFAATAELLADGFEALDRYGLLGEFRNENKEVLDRFTKILRGLEMRPSSGLSTRAKELMGGQDDRK